MKCYCDINLHPLIRYHSEKQEKDYALLLSFVGQARLRFAGVHSLFLAFWCTVIEIGGTMRRFTFLVSDVSISWVYLLSQMLFLKLMYLHWLNIRRCRCLCGNCCICNTLIFIVADAFLAPPVSALT